MLKRHILSFTTAAACAIGLSGCSTVSNVMDTATSYVPYILKPYRADVHQGNLVTSEMALQLEKGMTDAQVQFLLGVPLIKDPFHENRWDYTYYLRRGNGEEQVRSLTVFFNEDRRVDHWTSDPLPDEQQADQLILGTIDTFEPRLPKTDIPAAAQNCDRTVLILCRVTHAYHPAGSRETSQSRDAAHQPPAERTRSASTTRPPA